MTVIRTPNLQGGISKKDKTIIGDNQLSIGTNVFYNKDKNLQIRGGQRAVGSPVPDNSVVIEAADAVTNFTVADDAINLVTGVAKRGTFSVQFDINVATSGNDRASLLCTPASVNITNLKGYITFWIFVPTGFNTNLTDVRWRYGSDASNYYEFTLPTLTENAWNFIKITYDGYWNLPGAVLQTTKSIAADTAATQGIFFRPDGFRMYVCAGSLKVLEYQLTTAWDVGSANLLHTFTATGTSNPHSVSFKSDGSKMYLLNNSSRIYEYNLPIPWDVSSAVQFQNATITSGGLSTGLVFSPDGLRAYTTSAADGFVYQHALGTAWDISTVSFVQSIDVNAQDSLPEFLYLRADGQKLFMTGQNNTRIYEYNMPTPFDLSTLTLVQSKLVSAQDTAPTGIFFKPDGNLMYMGGNANDAIYQYRIFNNIGSPVDAAMDFFTLRINYTAGYTNKTGIRVDAFSTYSQTSNKPMMSLKFFRSNTTPQVDYLFTNVGTGFYLFNPTVGTADGTWELIKSGLTDGKRFGNMDYKNVMYFGNGTDNYFSFDGTLISEHTGANTFRGPYMALANDVGFITDPSVPTTLAYTPTTPANLNTFTNAVALDQDDSSGTITGLIALGPLMVVTKERKIYKVNILTSSREPLDYDGGALSDRSLVNVENEVFFLNDKGEFTLAQREATIGSLRADPITDDISAIIDMIANKDISAGIYASQVSNVYLFADSNNDGFNDLCLVRSVLTNSWTQYAGVNANEAVIHPDIEGEQALLLANSLSGQMVQMEYGSDDFGSEILVEIETKTQDYGKPEQYKTFHTYDFFGFINEGGQLTIHSTLGEQEITTDAILLGTTYSSIISSTQSVLGGSLLGGSTLGGGANTVTLYPFVIRVPLEQTDNNLSINVSTDIKNTVAVFTKYAVDMDAMTQDFFPNSYIA